MDHPVGKQSIVVFFGRVTAKLPGGSVQEYQQGQVIPPGAVITSVVGDNENDASRSTAKLKELLGIKPDSKPEPKE